MDKKIIFTSKAPAPIGPYSQAVVSGNTLYLSGQIAINPNTNELCVDSITQETEQVMENIKAVLEAAQASFESVNKVTIFIKDMNQFAQINEVYGRYFKNETAPARETVQVAALPKNVNIEISLIATLSS